MAPGANPNPQAARDEEANAPLHRLKDVTRPGQWASRRRPVRMAEDLGGAAVLWNPWLNRGTNFSVEEREQLGLEGLLPPAHEDLDLQAARVMLQLQPAHLQPLDKYCLLRQYLSSNQTTFYKCLVENIEALAPILYTPTVGEACTHYHRITRWGTEGIVLSAFAHRGRFAAILQQWPSHSAQIVVVSDGGRILGLGDLGANGMGIPVGKIALFCAAAGFHPEHSVPLLLDCGTDNQALLNDKFYQGERRPRLQGDEYSAVVDEMCAAVKEVWPHALLQFEDFETSHAFAILHRQRNKMLCFNDDIQGTGAVVTAGFINGLKAQGAPPAQARVVFFGAGSSAVGVAEALAAYLEHEAGVDREEARKCIFLVDSKGLVTTTRGDELPEHKRIFARRPEEDAQDFGHLQGLKEIIAAVKPHALIGLSAAGPSWGEDVIQELCSSPCECPMVFPLSNPTEKAEITLEDAVKWSGGRCIFASGSPFDPVTYEGQEIVPGQANNVFIFPGMGFGCVMSKAREATDAMFTAAAKALAGCVREEEQGQGHLYPPISRLRETSMTVAAAVAHSAWTCGVSQLEQEPADWRRHCEERAWWPDGRTTKLAGMECEEGVSCDE